MSRKAPSTSSLREATDLLWSASTRYARSKLLLSLGIVIASSVITALAPVALKVIVDAFATAGDESSTRIVMLIGLYILSQWAARVLSDIRVYVHAQADRRIDRTLSNRLFSHVMQLPLRYHMNRQTGALNETLTNGLSGYHMVLQTIVYTVLPVFVQLAIVASVLTSLVQPVFMFIFVVALVCYGVAFSAGTMQTTRTARDASAAQIEARAVMTDSVINYETVKYFTAEPLVQQRLDHALSRTEVGWLAFYRARTLNGLLVGTIFAAFLAITVLHATNEVLKGRMTVGTFVLINTYVFQLVSPIEQLGFAAQTLSQGFAFLEKMLELFREKRESDEGLLNEGGLAVAPRAEADPGEAPGELVFERVTASYRADRTVLRDVSFRLPAGHSLGIVGASGAGKSTLVRLLVRFIDPDSGRLMLDGVPVIEMPLPQLRQSIAVVPQDTVLFNDTIGYNIAFGRPGSDQAAIEHAARTARLHDFIMSLPEGYDTPVGERGVKLSGGEKQRVSIARAALRRPRIYVFDEATSSLDSRTEREILLNLRELSRHATTLVIAHRLSTVIHADEILVMDHGLAVERGTHESLLCEQGLYAKLWSAQQSQTARAGSTLAASA